MYFETANRIEAVSGAEGDALDTAGYGKLRITGPVLKIGKLWTLASAQLKIGGSRHRP
jgi:hypothetical protein